MKKTIISTVVLALAAILVSCGNAKTTDIAAPVADSVKVEVVDTVKAAATPTVVAATTVTAQDTTAKK